MTTSQSDYIETIRCYWEKKGKWWFLVRCDEDRTVEYGLRKTEVLEQAKAKLEAGLACKVHIHIVTGG